MAQALRDLAVMVLAAGQGTRMKSRRAKVLHDLAGWPMLAYPLAAAGALQPERLVVVVGRDADAVRETFAGRAQFVLQHEQRGTGHAVLEARSALEGFTGAVLVLYGDCPLLRPESLERLVELRRRSGAPLVMLTSPEPLPGRVVRGPDGRVERVVEVTDASAAELEIQEGNTGVYLVDAELLWKGLSQVGDGNAQGEIYLTDLVGFAVAEGLAVESIRLEDPDESLGINTRAELARGEAVLRRRIAQRHMRAGVTLVDPASTYIDMDVEIGRDTRIEPGCVLQGATVVGEGCHLKPHCVIESAVLEDDVTVGPAAHLRPGTQLGRGSRIGNYVEIKNSRLGAGVKADHLAYIGDADVGDGASFGCGAIVVNYDGVEKHRTQVEAGAFIGCNVNLIAPVRVARDAFVAAGTTVTGDVPAGALAVARARQRNVEGWRRRRRRVAPRDDEGGGR